jgi:ribosomal protein L37AE/L43A
MGDRECPNCEEFTMFEHGINQWKCEKCNEIFDEEYLDECED